MSNSTVFFPVTAPSLLLITVFSLSVSFPHVPLAHPNSIAVRCLPLPTQLVELLIILFTEM